MTPAGALGSYGSCGFAAEVLMLNVISCFSYLAIELVSERVDMEILDPDEGDVGTAVPGTTVFTGVLVGAVVAVLVGAVVGVEVFVCTAVGVAVLAGTDVGVLVCVAAGEAVYVGTGVVVAVPAGSGVAVGVVVVPALCRSATRFWI